MRYWLVSLIFCVVVPLLGVESRQVWLGTEETPKGAMLFGEEFPGAKGSIKRLSEGETEFVRLEFDLRAGRYVAYLMRRTIEFGGTSLVMDVRASEPNARLFVRTVDSKRRTHFRWVRGPFPVGEWTRVKCRLDKFDGTWGKDDDKSISWPIQEVVVGYEPAEKDYPVGTVDLCRFYIETTSARSVTPGVSITVKHRRFSSLYYPDEDIEARYRLGTLEVDGTLARYEVVHVLRDWQGRPLHFEEARPEADGSYVFRYPASRLGERYGAFRLDIEARHPFDPGDQHLISHWFGRLTGPNPSPHPKIGTGIHGHHGWINGDYRFVDILSAAGFGIVRNEIQWGLLEKERGKVVVPKIVTDYIDLLVERGIRTNYLLSYGNTLYENPYDSQAFANWAAKMAEIFKGKIDIFEIWNEPANFGFQKRYGGDRWGNAPWLDQFVSFTRLADEAIRRVQPGATVVVASEDVWQTVRQEIEQGIAASHNSIALHPYCHGQPRPEYEMVFKDGGRELRELCVKHGGATRACVTEVGWTTYQGNMQYLEIAGGYPKSSYRHQAQYIIRAYLLTMAAGMDYMLQYDFMNDGSNRSYTEHNFGLVHEDYSPKPSLMAIAFLTRTLEHASLVKDLSDTPTEHRLYQFKTKDGKPIVIGYALEETKQVTVKVDEAQCQVFDLQGNRLPAKPKDGKLDLMLSELPVYLHGMLLD